MELIKCKQCRNQYEAAELYQIKDIGTVGYICKKCFENLGKSTATSTPRIMQLKKPPKLTKLRK